MAAGRTAPIRAAVDTGAGMPTARRNLPVPAVGNGWPGAAGRSARHRLIEPAVEVVEVPGPASRAPGSGTPSTVPGARPAGTEPGAPVVDGAAPTPRVAPPTAAVTAGRSPDPSGGCLSVSTERRSTPPPPAALRSGAPVATGPVGVEATAWADAAGAANRRATAEVRSATRLPCRARKPPEAGSGRGMAEPADPALARPRSGPAGETAPSGRSAGCSTSPARRIAKVRRSAVAGPGDDSAGPTTA